MIFILFDNFLLFWIIDIFMKRSAIKNIFNQISFYFILVYLFVLDLFFHYRVYKTGCGPDTTASNPTAMVASGGKVPEY